MALVTVHDDETEDGRSKPRWSAGKKLDVVLRLLRGDKLDWLMRACTAAPAFGTKAAP